MTTIEMRLTAIRYAAAHVNFYEFTPATRGELLDFGAGAHIDIHLPNGLIRQYSLVNEWSSGKYVVAVKLDKQSRGGSRAIHETLRVGAILQVSAPRNNFLLNEAAAHSVFIAGGIGVTPIAAMVARLKQIGKSWTLHYAVRARDEALFLDELGVDGLHVDLECEGRPLDVAAIVAAAPPRAHLYCCGPAPMLDAFETAGAQRDPDTVHVERFTARDASTEKNSSYIVKLARSGVEFEVPSGQSLLNALREHGVDVPTSCEQGICGTCETSVVAGTPDHKDSLLSPAEKAANKTMMVCCSGCISASLILDL